MPGFDPEFVLREFTQKSLACSSSQLTHALVLDAAQVIFHNSIDAKTSAGFASAHQKWVADPFSKSDTFSCKGDLMGGFFMPMFGGAAGAKLHQPLQASGFLALESFWQYRTEITSLDLSGNDLHTDGSEYLTTLLPLTSLRCLNLGRNMISEEQGLANLTSLANFQLQELNLNLNFIGRMIPHLSVLTALTGLTSLDLGRVAPKP